MPVVRLSSSQKSWLKNKSYCEQYDVEHPLTHSCSVLCLNRSKIKNLTRQFHHNGARERLYMRKEKRYVDRFTCPVPRPTTRSAMVVSSVSPLRWDTITPQSFCCERLEAFMASVTEPIWFTLRSRQLQAFWSIAWNIGRGCDSFHL